MEYNVINEDAPEGMEALEIASLGLRFGAFLVDFVISVIVGIVGGVIANALGDDSNVLGLIISIGYWIVVILMVATRGQSPGKIAVGIKIVKADGGSVGIGTALIREVIGKFISTLIIFIGYIWILFDSKRQCLHDKIATTYVVKA